MDQISSGASNRLHLEDSFEIPRLCIWKPTPRNIHFALNGEDVGMLYLDRPIRFEGSIMKSVWALLRYGSLRQLLDTIKREIE